MSYTSKVSPCKGCEERHERCHVKCSDYIDWNKERLTIKEKADKNRRLEAEVDEYYIKSMEKKQMKRR